MIVAGTSIGIGMLTLPAFLASSGLFYASICIIGVWAIMWASALAFAELSWHLPIGTNMLNMSEQTLGKAGKVLMGINYIMLLYALSSVYLSSLNAVSGYLLPSVEGYAIYFWVIILALLLFFSFKILDVSNRLMMTVMIVSFLGLVFGLSLSENHVEHIALTGPAIKAMHVLPLLITSYGFQIVVPSVHGKLGNDSSKHLKSALLYGSLIPLIFYLLWFWVMMHQLTPSVFSEMIITGQPVALLPEYLARILKYNWVKPLSMCLVCSAIGTSWLGVSLSILDFFKDSKLARYALGFTLLPPLLLVKFSPNIFLMALQYSGYLVAILLIIFPAIMLLRYRRQHKITEQFISHIALILVLIFGILVLFL